MNFLHISGFLFSRPLKTTPNKPKPPHFRNKPIKQAVCDRGYVGAKVVLGVNIILPKKALKRDNRYQQEKPPILPTIQINKTAFYPTPQKTLGILQKISPVFAPIKQAVCDRGYVGAKVVLGANIILPKKALKRDNRYQQDKKRKLCKRRAAIEPIIRHLYPTPQKTLGILQKISPVFAKTKK
jgi:hypothetical protein